MLPTRDYPLPVRLASKVYSRVKMHSFIRFSRYSGTKCSLKCSVNSQHLSIGKEEEWNHPGVVENFVSVKSVSCSVCSTSDRLIL